MAGLRPRRGGVMSWSGVGDFADMPVGDMATQALGILVIESDIIALDPTLVAGLSMQGGERFSLGLSIPDAEIDAGAAGDVELRHFSSPLSAAAGCPAFLCDAGRIEVGYVDYNKNIFLIALRHPASRASSPPPVAHRQRKC